MSFHSQHEMVAATSQDISSHAFASSLPRHHQSEGHMHGSTGTIARKFRGDTRGKLRGEQGSNGAFGLTQLEWNEISAEAMRRHVGNDRSGAKLLADRLECSPRTAENYLQAKTAPSGIHFLRALSVIPEFQAEVRRIASMHTDMDPELERATTALIQAYQRKQGRE